MRKFILSILFPFFLTIHASCQEKENKWELKLHMSTVDKIPSLGGLTDVSDNRYLNGGIRKNKSLAIGLGVLYLFKENCHFQLKAIISSNSITENNEYTEISGTVSRDSFSIKNNNIGISPGILFEKKFERFSIYSGFELPIILYGKTKFSNSSRTTDIRTDTIIDNVRIKNNSAGGFAIGIGSVYGIKFPLNSRISLCADLCLGYLYSKIGGITEVTVTSDIHTTQVYPPTVINYSYKDVYENIFSLRTSFLISIAYNL